MSIDLKRCESLAGELQKQSTKKYILQIRKEFVKQQKCRNFGDVLVGVQRQLNVRV